MHRYAKVVLWALLMFGAMLFQEGMAQPLNGVWRGKISVPQGIGSRTYQVELKLIRVEDSLRGMAYYYQGGERYARSLVRGYVDPADGTVRWWDEQLLEGSMPAPANGQITVSADFNCPGEGIMKLDGETSIQNRQPGKTGEVHLDKKDGPVFPDGWDELIADGPVEGSDIQRILELEKNLAQQKVSVPTTAPVRSPAPSTAGQEPVQAKAPAKNRDRKERSRETIPGVAALPPMPESTPPQSIEDKFVSRKKQLVAEFPLTGDTLEINFYDHAEIDGDSISLFVNNQVFREHILLKASPYTLKFAVSELREETELIMVAENLGSIPPNTSLMIAYINGVRHEARLESTENTSAMIRFIKPSGVKRQP